MTARLGSPKVSALASFAKTPRSHVRLIELLKALPIPEEHNKQHRSLCIPAIIDTQLRHEVDYNQICAALGYSDGFMRATCAETCTPAALAHPSTVPSTIGTNTMLSLLGGPGEHANATFLTSDTEVSYGQNGVDGFPMPFDEMRVEERCTDSLALEFIDPRDLMLTEMAPNPTYSSA